MNLTSLDTPLPEIFRSADGPSSLVMLVEFWTVNSLSQGNFCSTAIFIRTVSPLVLPDEDFAVTGGLSVEGMFSCKTVCGIFRILGLGLGLALESELGFFFFRQNYFCWFSWIFG